MSFFENVLYGFVSGLAEFLPVSSRAHQILIRYLLGVATRDPVQDLLVHIGLLFSIFFGCRDLIFRLRRQQKLNLSRKRKHAIVDGKSVYDLRLMKTATAPLLVGLLLLFSTVHLENNLLFVLAFGVLNAFILLLAEHSSRGNKDSRTMSGLDGIIIGVLGSLSVFPGISRTGIVSSYATLRGADSQNAANWAILLGVPALIILSCFDLFSAFSFAFSIISFSSIIGYIISGVAAFCGGSIAISLFQIILSRSGFNSFAYYSLGTALFSFVLYLIT